MMKRVSLTIPAKLLRTADELARSEGLNRSQLFSKALQAYTSGEYTADITPSYTPDNTKILLLEQDVLHKEALLIERERVIEALQYRTGVITEAATLPKTAKHWWNKIRRR